jgi:hypothetical protein
MSATNRPDNFAGRVNYAAQVIANKRGTSRAFDNCFENYDGDEVLAALVLRSQCNERLAANLPRYINAESIAKIRRQFETMTARQISAQAAKTRAAALARWHQPQPATA